MRYILIVGILVLTTGLIIAAKSVVAQESEQFKIENSTILQDSNDIETDASPTQKDTVRSTRLGQQGYSALTSDSPLRMRVKKIVLDHSGVINSNMSIEESPVEIMYTGDGGFIIQAALLQNGNTTKIFNATGCSYGKTSCFTTLAQPWTEDQVDGFGYSVVGAPAEEDFVNDSYFRPFSVRSSNNPSGVVIAQHEGASQPQTIRLRTKLNETNPKQGTFSQTVIITSLQDW